jgi:hypothetical protein
MIRDLTSGPPAPSRGPFDLSGGNRRISPKWLAADCDI